MAMLKEHSIRPINNNPTSTETMWFLQQINFFVILLITCAQSDRYIDEIQDRCYKTNQIRSCFKYKILRYINNFKINNYSLISDNTVKIIEMPYNQYHTNETISFPEAKQFPIDNELMKIVKFLQRSLNRLINTQGVVVDLPVGAQIISDNEIEGRKKKDKKSILFPLLTLMKLFKLTVLTKLILLGVIVIKKILIAAAIILPSVIASVKTYCKTQYVHVPYHVEEGHHYHHDYEHDVSEYEPTSYGDKQYWDRNRIKRITWTK